MLDLEGTRMVEDGEHYIDTNCKSVMNMTSKCYAKLFKDCKPCHA